MLEYRPLHPGPWVVFLVLLVIFNCFQKIVLPLMRSRLNPRNDVNPGLFKQPFSLGRGAVLRPETVRYINPGQWRRLAASAAAMG
jgi:hypothetical protein